MPKPTIFVSHSHLDSDWCRQFVSALQRLGYDVWYDEKGLSGGSQWVSTIERELERREVFAVILTPESWASDWVQLELRLALVTKRRIVPIMLKDTGVSGFVQTYQRINASGVAGEAVAREFDAAASQPAVAGGTSRDGTESMLAGEPRDEFMNNMDADDDHEVKTPRRFPHLSDSVQEEVAQMVQNWLYLHQNQTAPTPVTDGEVEAGPREKNEDALALGREAYAWSKDEVLRRYTRAKMAQ